MSAEKYLREQAGRTWNLLSKAHRHGIRLREETITERLLLSIALDADPKALTVKHFTVAEENRNGSDWEWQFSSPTCSIGFRVQAKKLNFDPPKVGDYKAFSPGGKQTSDLIREAKRDGCNPVFVFYNHPEIKDHSQMQRRGNYRTNSIWGCSVGHAIPLSTIPDSKLQSVIPNCSPWHELFSNGNCAANQALPNVPPGQLVFRAVPNWARLILDGVDLTEYCAERNLVGVAHFQATELFPDHDFKIKSRRS